jgi:hypothetical protein
LETRVSLYSSAIAMQAPAKHANKTANALKRKHAQPITQPTALD